MRLKVKTRTVGPGLPLRLWGVGEMKELAVVTQGAMVRRAFRQGRDVKDQPFRRYSTRPIYIGGSTARRLAPKGGRRTDGGSTYYSGGYAEYKRLSRQFSGEDAPVDLTLSGQLRRSVRVVRVLRYLAEIGPTGSAAIYGAGVGKARPFVGVSPNDSKALRRALTRLVRKAMNRSRAR